MSAGRVGVRRGAFLVVALAAALSASAWRLTVGDALTDAVESRLLDLRFNLRGPWAVVESVAVVTVDEAAATEFGSPARLRDALARALPKIEAGGARAVMLFLIQRNDAARFGLAGDIDPHYLDRFQAAVGAGVEAIAYCCRLDPAEGIDLDRAIPMNGPVP